MTQTEQGFDARRGQLLATNSPMEMVERLRKVAVEGGMPLGKSFDCCQVADLIERLCWAGDDLAKALASFNDPEDQWALRKWGTVRNN